MTAGGISVAAFGRDALLELFGEDSAVEYLYAYLTELGARTILIEHHYVDRHYLEEFATNYAKTFRAPEASCARVHFFSDTAASEVEALLEATYDGDAPREAAQRTLQASYLGFVVRRPLGHALVGRTVLQTYPVEGRRHYEVVRPYRVHIALLELTVLGLAYQQQDGAAAVCASTALWSALQRVAHMAGHRTPTPQAITDAARSPFPASNGLDLPQMATALCSLGYVADVFQPATNRAAFRSLVVTALRSHLPVILLVGRRDVTGAGKDAGTVEEGHAVCVTGFSEPDGVVDVPPPVLTTPSTQPIRVKDAAVSTIYVHDDNIGSHAHYELIDVDDLDDNGHRKLILRRGRTGNSNVPWWVVDDWTIIAALVPKPANLRTAVSDVFHDILYVRPLAMQLFSGLELHFSARVASGVEYKRALSAHALDRNHIRGFVETLTLPRYVGVVSVHDSVTHLCDFVLDVSQVRRTQPVLGIVAPGVPFGSLAWTQLVAFAARVIKVPLIWAPSN